MRTVRSAVVYGKPRQRECAAVSEGLQALGAAVTWRNHGYWDPATGVLEDADVIATFGQRLWSKKIAAAYRERGVPVLTVDLPPLRIGTMADDYRALWLDWVNWLPGDNCPSDRLTRLFSHYRIQFERRRNAGERVLLCGQCAEDAAHGLGALELRDWFQLLADTIAEFNALVWRPHPRDRFKLNGFPMSDPDQPIAEVLREDWHAVATLNSTSGLEAILNGLPVFCSTESFYGDIANTNLATLQNPWWPGLGRRAQWFARLAYSQWTFGELASGEAIRYALGQIESTQRPQTAA